MSFSAFLEIQYVENQISIETISENLKKILDEDGIHPDVLDGLNTAFEGTETMFNVPATYLSYLVERIAGLQPAVSFHARGRGEELRDIWVREFQNGEPIFSVGSFL
ncbi:hypothetical protein [Polaromonas sp. YR568]|uniref:hypothetical protein n=1 Tax=Polaromonas sp. YR568 TaxID=1855301 RepID=UPI00398BD96E